MVRGLPRTANRKAAFNTRMRKIKLNNFSDCRKHEEYLSWNGGGERGASEPTEK
jgi:hypothetical protein